MSKLILPLLIWLQITCTYPTFLANPFKCFIWDTTCVTALAQNIGPGYIQKIPDLNAARLDPLEIDYLRLERDGLLFEIKDTKVHGLNNLIVDEIRSYSNINLGRVLFRTDIFFTGRYKTNGTIFFYPVYGEGDYWSSFKNMEIELFIPYNIVKNADGIEFIQASNYTLRYDVKDNAQLRYDNLYYGDTARSELMHTLLNSNWKFVTAQYSRFFVTKIVDSMAKAYKNYFRKTPLRFLVEF